ncbi:MAG: glycosyltransferase family 4 protein, partial [Leptospiraceae bacterium]|nr:glycosyltransferase family 4 protein [Leptospiraceae bacterium]
GLFFNFQLPFILGKSYMDLFWGSQQVIPPLLPRNLPSVLTYCDLVLYLFPGTMRKIAAFQQKIFQKYSVKKAKFILCISEQTRTDLLSKFLLDKSITGISYPGVDVQQIQDLLAKKPSESIQNLNEPFLLSVSTVEPRKNYSFLLQTYSKYREIAGVKKLKWVIVGKIGWEKQEFLKEIYSQIEKYGDILWYTNTDDVDLHHLYKKCRLFLFASIYEGFGIPLLEALSHSKNCLVSDIPTFREIGEDKITYLPTTNPKVWAKKILELQDKNDIIKIDINKFSWENAAKTTQASFDKVLNEKISY